MNEENEQPRIIRLEETTSTNNYLRGLVGKESLPEGSIVVTEYQTAGRGQVGNTWESEPGKNLMFSIILYPDFLPANRQFLISQIAALSVKETLDAYVDGITVKWPNDIYWRDKKICGMLIENDLTGHSLYCSVIGIGININQREFLSDALNPVSLVQITGREYDQEEILNSFLKRLYDRYLGLLQEKEEEIRSAYMAALYRGNGFHPYRDEQGVFQACILGIEPTGHLILKTDNGEVRRYAFKEVSVVNT
ncbi:biotin--[acetyl-CoA-carboxylase] ligase [Parabacteroides goldsteinii]|uniref:biotin--[acetyl-CoA-carboxylase] ligase n=1 Tax=Parabacteroides goldsteinii TaxID=328812 RepID=UPI0032B2C12C